MKKILNNKTIWLVGLSVLVLVGVGCAWFLRKNEVQTVDFSDEQMDEYFGAYAEMVEKGNKEDILIVMSPGRPEAYGAIDVVEGPNQTYFLMYDSDEARDEAYEKLKEDETVSVEKNVKMQLLEHDSWGVVKMGLDSGINVIGEGGEPVEVAIIDTGLDVELFKENYPERTLTTYNIEAGSYDTGDMVDYNGHGTHIAGIIADGTPSNVSIHVVRAIRGTGSDLYSADVVTAIYEAVNSGAKVINVSLGAYVWIDAQKEAIDYAKERNVVTTASAGNDGVSDIMYPAGYDSTLSISATNPDDGLANYSNYGETIDFAAPGSYIKSINGYMSGTSMAAPHAAAAVAVLKSFNPELSFDGAKELLIHHVNDLGEAGWDQQFGYGLIDFNNAEFCGEGYCDGYGVFAVDMTVHVDSEEVEAKVVEDGIVINADEACTVIVSEDGGETYTVVSANELTGEEGGYKFNFDINDGVEVAVALRGDGDLDGEVSSADSNLINRSLISSSLRPHIELTALQRVLFDLDKDGEVSSADSNLINRSLISDSLPPYQKIAW